ncbi:MAG: O-Antigen ligase [Pseudonocardiales bacterium]|nr:O-Antigen ligase [Pseudonocardiales bacterium]
MTSASIWMEGRRSPAALIVGVIAIGFSAGFLGINSFRYTAIVLTLLVAAAIVARQPVAFAILAFGGVFVAQRLGGATSAPGANAGGVSYSDALITGAMLLALPVMASTPELRRLRQAGLLLGVYLAMLLPGIIDHHSARAYLEWIHRLVIVGGAMLVGAWLAREHKVRTAFRLSNVLAAFIGASAVVDTLTHGFHPASPYGLNKNFIGSLLGLMVVVFIVAHKEIQWPTWVLTVTCTFAVAGLLASQSRGGALGCALGVLIAFGLDLRNISRTVRVIGALAIIGLSIASALSIKDQFSQSSQQFNNSSLGIRFQVEHVTQDIWRTSPITGVGLKYFNTGVYGPLAIPPNNVIDNELAESGLLGLGGFLILNLGLFAVLIRRRRQVLIRAAAGALAGNLLHGMVDVYWLAGTITFVFLLIGIALSQPVESPKGKPNAIVDRVVKPRPQRITVGSRQ